VHKRKVPPLKTF